MHGVGIEIFGDTARVGVLHAGLAGQIAARLLAAADDPRLVRTVTDRGLPGFVVPVEVARAAGLVDEPSTEPDSEQPANTSDTGAATPEGVEQPQQDAPAARPARPRRKRATA